MPEFMLGNLKTLLFEIVEQNLTSQELKLKILTLQTFITIPQQIILVEY